MAEFMADLAFFFVSGLLGMILAWLWLLGLDFCSRRDSRIGWMMTFAVGLPAALATWLSVSVQVRSLIS